MCTKHTQKKQKGIVYPKKSRIWQRQSYKMLKNINSIALKNVPSFWIKNTLKTCNMNGNKTMYYP